MPPCLLARAFISLSEDYDDRRREYHETPEEKLRATIIKFGEVVCILRLALNKILLSH